MMKSDKSMPGTRLQRELKRLKQVEKAHGALKMGHELLKKASCSLWTKKRNLHAHRQPM